MRKILELITEYRQFLVYSIIGASGATIDFVVFSALVYFDVMHYLLANLISVTIGITNNFVLNILLNFKVRDQYFKRFFSFYLIGLLGLGVSTIILYVLVDTFELNEMISKFLTIFAIVLLQYNMNKRFSFARS